jgi:hypothetical protein|tara:strand:- start:95 stop:472 length:378 start_codon:yes stop_codon:yes gene_type:complete
MTVTTIMVCIIVILSVSALYFTEDKVYESHKISPVSGEKTKYTVCVQDPKLNRGFIISISNVNELREIQTSLKNADSAFVIDETMGKYYLINRRHKREQILKECSFKMLKNIMHKSNTNSINYSV